jgi:hypothetical protein
VMILANLAISDHGFRGTPQAGSRGSPADQGGHQPRQPISLVLPPAIPDGDVLSLDESDLA